MANTLGNRLKTIRETLRLSQEELGREVRAKQATINNIEHDKTFPNRDILEILHKKYSADLNWLICGDGNMELSWGNQKIEMPAAGDEKFPEKYVVALEGQVKDLKEHIQLLKTVCECGKRK